MLEKFLLYTYVTSIFIMLIAMCKELVIKVKSDLEWRDNREFDQYALNYGDILKGLFCIFMPAVNSIGAFIYAYEFIGYVYDKFFKFLKVPIIPRKSKLDK